MRFRIPAAIAVTLTLASCDQPDRSPEGSPAAQAPVSVTAEAQSDARFTELSARWVDGRMRLSPLYATAIGDHRFDGDIDDLSADGRRAAAEFSQKLLTELSAIDSTALSRENQVDALILRNQLEYDLWGLNTSQEWAWDPQVYSQAAGGAIYSLMARDFAPVSERLANVTLRIEKLPRLYAQMRENLDPKRVPKVHAETVSRQHAGVLSLIDEMVLPAAEALDAESRQRLDAAIATLRTSVAEQQTWIDQELVPKAEGDFRIGQALYDAKLRFALNSELSRADIGQRAEAEITRVREQMYQIAREVLADRPEAPTLPESPDEAQQQAAIEAALELAYADKPARDQVVATVESTLEEATRFTREKDLVTLPDAPVKIILMPEFQRGVSVAYCDSPGPLDKHLDTFYAVSPIPEDWSDAQVDSFLREYNTRMLHLLTIHEAMPGHYVEGAHSAKHPSMLRGVLRSGMFAEGWAVYTEEVMMEQGYLDHDPLFKLMRYKFYLRAVANAILDQGVHVDNWTREQAMDLMVRRTFQQEREAAGKWVRVQLTSAQLPTYFVGVQEHFETRRAVMAREGEAFKLKAYHDRVLAYGAPPVRFVRQLMLDEAIR
ncbi:MAG: DUF885 domain-containing protein [Rhodanobacteraceae bacterium]|nr:DUF885 domain-containing protein [Rhodanobacteraceae bacterium]